MWRDVARYRAHCTRGCNFGKSAGTGDHPKATGYSALSLHRSVSHSLLCPQDAETPSCVMSTPNAKLRVHKTTRRTRRALSSPRRGVGGSGRATVRLCAALSTSVLPILRSAFIPISRTRYRPPILYPCYKPGSQHAPAGLRLNRARRRSGICALMLDEHAFPVLFMARRGACTDGGASLTHLCCFFFSVFSFLPQLQSGRLYDTTKTRTYFTFVYVR